MKKITFLLTLSVLAASCASTGPVGNWNYSVTATPQGDFSGVMTVTKGEKGYAAKLNGQTGEVFFKTFSYNKKEKKAEGTFDFSGTSILFNTQVEKDKMNGTMAAEGMEFPFTASRKK